MAMPFLFTSVEYIEFVKEMYILYIYIKNDSFKFYLEMDTEIFGNYLNFLIYLSINISTY